jgi:hypothetical protein
VGIGFRKPRVSAANRSVRVPKSSGLPSCATMKNYRGPKQVPRMLWDLEIGIRDFLPLGFANWDLEFSS